MRRHDSNTCSQVGIICDLLCIIEKLNHLKVFSSEQSNLFYSSSPGGLFGQPALQPGQPQPTQLYQQVTALSAPTLLGDERDSILAKWNQLQAYWGTGKGYYGSNNPPVEFTQENPFCRFKVRAGGAAELVVSCSSYQFEY